MSPFCLSCLLALSVASAVPAFASPADLCLDAARTAAEDTGVPLRILVALSLTETGRGGAADEGMEPWPWTLNRAGAGQWFETKDEALHALDDILAEGATNVDLGCFQLNWRWHAAAFPSAAAMLDPETNARYAARFVAHLYDKTGDWRAAAAAYHSATPERAEIYSASPIYDPAGHRPDGRDRHDDPADPAGRRCWTSAWRSRFALAILMLTVTLFIERPLDFSAFPTILLASLLLRLSLNVSSTKLIIGQGHTGTGAAGHVIEGFAEFIMAGNLVLGLVIFIVLLIVNFIVITKGAGRMAEVGARFALDGMPGRQLAIDADMSAGAIDHEEAKRRREVELAETTSSARSTGRRSSSRAMLSPAC
jgi:hypothetical protein